MTERVNNKPSLPLSGDTVELITDLSTGEKRLQRSKRKRRHHPSPIQRSEALKEWLADTGFTMIFYMGAAVYREAEAAKIASGSGQNVNYDDAIWNRDASEFALKKAFDPRKVRFKPIRAIDIVTHMSGQTSEIRSKLRGSGNWVQSYFDWTIDLMSEVRNYKMEFTKNLKVYSSQGVLIKAS